MLSNENNIFSNLNKYISKNISKDFLKNITIKYCALKYPLISLNNIYFNEILKEKILFNIINTKILLNFEEYLSQNDILDLISKGGNIQKYLDNKMKLYNILFNKLQKFLNSDIIIDEIYFRKPLKEEFKYFYDLKNILLVDYEKDIINYNENEANEEKNILINHKIKRIEIQKKY